MLNDSQAKANIKANVRFLLGEKGISQSRLAMETDETPMMISRVCNGEHVPNAATLARIAEVLHTSVDWILADHSSEVRKRA